VGLRAAAVRLCHARATVLFLHALTKANFIFAQFVQNSSFTAVLGISLDQWGPPASPEARRTHVLELPSWCLAWIESRIFSSLGTWLQLHGLAYHVLFQPLHAHAYGCGDISPVLWVGWSYCSCRLLESLGDIFVAFVWTSVSGGLLTYQLDHWSL
jgi:hypothetical protein